MPKYLDETGLARYDGKIKNYITAGLAEKLSIYGGGFESGVFAVTSGTEGTLGEAKLRLGGSSTTYWSSLEFTKGSYTMGFRSGTKADINGGEPTVFAYYSDLANSVDRYFLFPIDKAGGVYTIAMTSDVAAVSSALSSEATTRANADTALGGRISTLENAGFITNTVNNLTNYYTKTDTYSKTEVNSLLGTNTLHFVVTTKDWIYSHDGDTHVIYLIPNEGPSDNYYDEYVWVDKGGTYKYELIGTTQVDLSGYVPTSRTVNGHALTANITLVAADISDVYSKTETNNLLNGKVDKVTGKGLSTNDFTTTEKNKLSGIAAGAQVNVIETVKVNGTTQTPSSKAVNITVPTKVSDLTNDSGFITGVTSISNAEIDALFP